MEFLYFSKDCGSWNCLNGGTCIPNNGNPYCECGPYWTGINCQTSKFDLDLKPNVEGTCLYPTFDC